MHLLLTAFVSVAMLLTQKSAPVQIYDDFPKVVDADGRYVIYSHGFIVEGTDPRPVHPTRGVYDFPAIKQALFNGGNFNLIAHHRPKGTEIGPYADRLEAGVRRLVAAGVKPGRITLVGFSRGGTLTAYASSQLGSLGVNTAIMAACDDGDIARQPPLVLSGHVLSIYETSDTLGSCDKIAARSRLSSFKEVPISTGKEHGAFFRPIPEWVAPLRAWIEETNR